MSFSRLRTHRAFASMRRAPRAALVAALAAASLTVPARAQSVPAAGPAALPIPSAPAAVQIAGSVVDAQTGLPLSGARVRIAGRTAAVTSGADGRFAFAGIAPGGYRLEIRLTGYQPTQSQTFSVGTGQAATVTLALERATSGESLAVIGSTAVRSSAALAQSSVITRNLPTESLVESGVNRAADALRDLPAITNSLKGNTASFGDDVPLDIHGIGALETTAELDGHPIGLGFPGGYNYQISPVVGVRNIAVTYGSGSNVLGASAIGGAIDFQTLEPTLAPRVNLAQGFGTFSHLASDLSATGSTGKLGYALAYGVDGIDGPLKNVVLPQPGAAYDQSATDPAVRALGTYAVDSTAVARTGFAKLRFAASSATAITFTGMSSSYWENKTGNGDGDYLDYGPALSIGNTLLASYKPSAYPKLAACPAGQFVGTNANGVPNGSAPGGAPDGGSACQTPQQYAALNTGYDGAGPAWQSFNLADAHLGFVTTPRNQVIRIDAFTDDYRQINDRTFQLPLGSPSTHSNRNESETGFTVSDEFPGRSDTFGLGYSYLNLAYALASTNGAKVTINAPGYHETGVLAHNVYHPPSSPLAVYTDALLQHASATSSTYLDPRASLVYKPSANDVVRVSAGATTTQPAGNQLGLSFVPTLPTGAGGGAAVNCGGVNSIGTTPSSALKPERGVDEEIAYGHRFAGDSQAQVTLYTTNIYDKLYSTIVPLGQVGSGFIDPAYLAAATAVVAAKCGAAAPSLIGLTGTYNVGALRARGLMFSGRQRLDRRTFVDYDYTLDSTAITSAPVALLRSNNYTLIPNSQLPNLPLHTFAGSLDHVFPGGIDVRYTVNAVSSNNSKNLPPYNFSDLRASIPAGPGLFAITVSNLFNQYAFIAGLRYEGTPYALNAYAPAAAYAPLGAGSTERFGLPDRAIYFNYSLSTR